MIERWFPCAEVSEASQVGWGSGNAESSLWVWFAKRPLVQAKPPSSRAFCPGRKMRMINDVCKTWFVVPLPDAGQPTPRWRENSRGITPSRQPL